MESNCIHARHVTRDANSNPFVRVVSGKRGGMFVERPWIILCPGQNAKGELRVKNTSKRNTAEERWNQNNHALHGYAEDIENDTSGNPKPLANYLKSLANISLPPEIESLYKKGGPEIWNH